MADHLRGHRIEATLVAATAIALAVVSDALSWAELYSRLAPEWNGLADEAKKR